VIVSQTPGLEGYLEDGRTGRWAPAGDPQALRELILALLSDRDEAARMASTARRLVEEGRNLDSYVSEVARVCLELVGCARVSPASG
jgi:glycosyltransferase involved in cell wall biosynthesis